MSRYQRRSIHALRLIACVVSVLAASFAVPSKRADAWFGGGIAFCMYQYSLGLDSCYSQYNNGFISYVELFACTADVRDDLHSCLSR